MPMGIRLRNIASEYITDTFIWDFKRGDNIIYNFEVLWALYEAKKDYSGNKLLFNKPIIIIITSIIECVLFDFVKRIQDRVLDHLPNITPAVVNDFKYKGKGKSIKVKKLSKFDHYLSQVEKHKIFGVNQANYKALNLLKVIRNNVHIQNSAKNEYIFYVDKNLRLSQSVLEGVLRVMITKYPRKSDGIFESEKFKNIFPWNFLKT